MLPAPICQTPKITGARSYERHRPEEALLYRILQEHWSGFLADVEVGGGGLPAFVLDEVDAYLRCGIPAHGFLRVRCNDCGHSRVVAFSCKRRGFCPSCLGRRMADTAAFCVDHVFPRAPVRQYVLTVPCSLRFKMAYSPEITSAVLRALIGAITSDLRAPTSAVLPLNRYACTRTWTSAVRCPRNEAIERLGVPSEGTLCAIYSAANQRKPLRIVLDPADRPALGATS